MMSSQQRFEENPCRPRHFRPPPPCAPVVTDIRTGELIESCRNRMLAAAVLFAFVFLVVALRLVGIAVLPGSKAEAHARVRPPPSQAGPPTPATVRADIVDRNGTLLATTLDTPSLYADPRQIIDPAEATKAITAVLPQLNPGEVYAKLSSGKSFVWLKRRLTPRQVYEVNRLGIPGFQFEHEERRVYPFGDVASHVVGYCGIDNNGLAGIERALDSSVKGRREPLQLSLDSRVQFVLREELMRVITDFSAKGAAGIVMDVRTGEVIAMVSLPDFDPNHPGMDPKEAKERIFNKITLGAYEMGSAFKIFNTAMALDAGTASMGKSYDAIHDLHIGRFTITDYHGKHRMLTVPEVFMYSSNLGSARMALEAGGTRQRDFLGRLGLLKPVTVEFDEVSRPHFPAQWREVNVITIAYGHGISVSPLHVATAVSAIVNGGTLRKPTVLKVPPGTRVPGDRVVSEKTSEQMRKLMRLVVENGTAKFAEAPGYLVGGKTGTAQKQKGRGYEANARLASFVGAFPMSAPRYVVFVMVDEPKPNAHSYGFATGGWVAAPVVSRIVQRMAPMLGLPPIPKDSPEAQNALLTQVSVTNAAE